MPQIESARPSRRTQLRLASAAFADGATIPKANTADGDDVSPPLNWTEPPAETMSFAIVCEDPDAPRGTFVHWLAWNIRGSMRELKEGVPGTGEPFGIRQGENGFGTSGYRGPSPPPGKPHRYVFRLLALDSVPQLETGATQSQVERALEGHVLAEARLIGLYGRR